MANEDQERFEDYIELERYIEELQTGKTAHPPTDMTPEQARIYQMATLFRSALPENAEPRQAFAEHLKARLLNQKEEQNLQLSSPATQQQVETKPPVQSPSVPDPIKIVATKRPVRFFSRRNLLAGGATAAASLLIGVGSEYAIEQKRAANTRQDSTNHVNNATPLPTTQLEISAAIPTAWHFVSTLADLGQNAIRFSSDTLIGYVVRASNTTTDNNNQIIALSAACTHMGCLVKWEETDRHFHCPCHDAMFAADGTSANTRYSYALSPLPHLKTKIEDGKIYVEIPQTS